MALEARERAVPIPAPKLTADVVGKNQIGVIPNLYAYLEPYQNADFMNYQPQYWLFRSRPGRKRLPLANARRNGYVWAHPIHLDGSSHTGERFWSGDNSGTNFGASRETEWPVAGSPFVNFLLSGVNLPSYFARIDGSIPLTPASFPILYDPPSLWNPIGHPVRMRGGLRNMTIRTLVLSCAIAIRNPDPATALQTPWVHGPLGNIIYVQPAIQRIGPGPQDKRITTLHVRYSLHSY